MSNVPSQPESRPFVGVHLKCCNVYVRAYLSDSGDTYMGWCPRCATQLRIQVVSQGGSRGQFFEAS